MPSMRFETPNEQKTTPTLMLTVLLVLLKRRDPV
jgi:hypothetical protein